MRGRGRWTGGEALREGRDHPNNSIQRKKKFSSRGATAAMSATKGMNWDFCRVKSEGLVLENKGENKNQRGKRGSSSGQRGAVDVGGAKAARVKRIDRRGDSGGGGLMRVLGCFEKDPKKPQEKRTPQKKTKKKNTKRSRGEG